MMFFAIFLYSSTCLQAQTISWKGHQWTVSAGGMAGVARGDPSNVAVDSAGYLHLRIAKFEGKWTASEVFTTDNLRFGTYQWVVEGDVYKMDKSTVLGLFTYGAAHHIGVDGENEIDIEFSQWNGTCHGCNADFTVYPATGNRKKDGSSSWEENFQITGGTLTRLGWNGVLIELFLRSWAECSRSGLLRTSFGPRPTRQMRPTFRRWLLPSALIYGASKPHLREIKARSFGTFNSCRRLSHPVGTDRPGAHQPVRTSPAQQCGR